MNKNIHVYPSPQKDEPGSHWYSSPHKLTGIDCWCRPEVRSAPNDHQIIVHRNLVSRDGPVRLQKPEMEGAETFEGFINLYGRALNSRGDEDA